MTEAAKASKQIKMLLKRRFPKVRFSVTSQTYTGGDSARVSWKDGPTTEKVKKLVGQYEMGTFDGMSDIYNYDNTRSDIPQVKYLFLERGMSTQTKQKLMKELGLNEGQSYNSQRELRAAFENMDLT